MTSQSSLCPPVHSFRVLVAEDSERQYTEVLALLRQCGIEPIRATNGLEAIRLAVSERPDVIVLDGLLPGMHGFEVARFIRQLDTAYRPYIALLTAIYKNVRYRNEATLTYGIDEYAIKPVSAATLSAILKRAGWQMPELKAAS